MAIASNSVMCVVAATYLEDQSPSKIQSFFKYGNCEVPDNFVGPYKRNLCSRLQTLETFLSFFVNVHTLWV